MRALEGHNYVECRRLEKAKRTDTASLNARQANMRDVGQQLMRDGVGERAGKYFSVALTWKPGRWR